MNKLMIGLSMLLFGATASAHTGHAAKDQLTGEIVDITCYLDHNSSGAAHAKCARACLKRGMPVGFLSGGRLYAVVLSGHASPNAKLAAYAGKNVTLTGRVLEKDGLRAIDLETVALTR